LSHLPFEVDPPRIMKTSIGVILLVLAVGGGLAFSQGQDPKDDVAKKVEVLENDLIATRLKAEAVAIELAETKASVAKIVQYLEAQARSAASMSETLDTSEQAGFTAGINPNSRQILLSGWREQLTTLQTDLPTAPKKPEPVKPADGKKPR
jgi:hypothetical protein